MLEVPGGAASLGDRRPRAGVRCLDPPDRTDTVNARDLPDDEPALITDAEARAADVSDDRLARVVNHPDGHYWVALDGHQQFGPFDSIEQALADMEVEENDFDAAPPSLEEVEDALGISSWIDPETGLPTEDSHVRLEDH